jgi:hypothetical protein
MKPIISSVSEALLLLAPLGLASPILPMPDLTATTLEVRAADNALGSFSATCPSWGLNSVYKTQLNAQCRDRNGNLVGTYISLNACLGNFNGHIDGAARYYSDSYI